MEVRRVLATKYEIGDRPDEIDKRREGPEPLTTIQLGCGAQTCCRSNRAVRRSCADQPGQWYRPLRTGWHEQVTLAAYVQDIVRCTGIRLNLLAQVVNVRFDYLARRQRIGLVPQRAPH